MRLSCNFKTVFVHWDLLTLAYFTSKAYYCVQRSYGCQSAILMHLWVKYRGSRKMFWRCKLPAWYATKSEDCMIIHSWVCTFHNRALSGLVTSTFDIKLALCNTPAMNTLYIKYELDLLLLNVYRLWRSKRSIILQCVNFVQPFVMASYSTFLSDHYVVLWPSSLTPKLIGKLHVTWAFFTLTLGFLALFK